MSALAILHKLNQVCYGLLPEKSPDVTHGDHEASERARRLSMWEADLEHQGIEARIGSERIDEWIAK
jgi:hypothetical protein